MNTYEFLSTLRDQSGLADQSQISTPLLLRMLNLGLKTVSNNLYKVFDQFLLKEVIDSSVTGTSVTAPADVLNIINVWREKTAAGGDYEICADVPITDKGKIGSIHWPSDDSNNPLYVDEGRNLIVYPALTTHGVKIQYRKRIADLAFGTTGILAVSDDIAPLDRYAVKDDDAYNDYYISFYSKGSNGAMSFEGTFKITDYTGSTRSAQLDSSTGLDGVSNEIWYALHPILPMEYDTLVVDAAMVQIGKNERLRKEGLITFDSSQLERDVRQQINTILGVNDVQEEQPKRAELNR
jgi:hypothetical protein